MRLLLAMYEFLHVGALLTHRAVRFTLRLETRREPARTFWKPRIIRHPGPSDAELQAAHRASWTKPEAGAPGAQAMWDAWAKAAEDWLLERAGISQGEEGLYRGRGIAPVIRVRMPLPIATHQRHGEVHGKVKIWTAQANLYRELARARLDHSQHYGDFLVAAIAANPPRGRDPLWTQRDLKIASGRATPKNIEVWAQERP